MAMPVEDSLDADALMMDLSYSPPKSKNHVLMGGPGCSREIVSVFLVPVFI